MARPPPARSTPHSSPTNTLRTRKSFDQLLTGRSLGDWNSLSAEYFDEAGAARRCQRSTATQGWIIFAGGSDCPGAETLFQELGSNMPRPQSWSRSPRSNSDNSGTFSSVFSPQPSSSAFPQPSRPTHRFSHSNNRVETALMPPPEASQRLSTGMAGPGPMQTRGMQRLEARRQMEEANFLNSKARSRHLNPSVDLRGLEYVSADDENLLCPICRCPFVDPVVLSECDHCFCRDCIRQSWASTYTPLEQRGDCPNCRTPARLGPRSSANKVLHNILDDLLVKCPRHEDGCTATLKRGEVQDHVSIYCPYSLQECPVLTCELPVRRKDADQGCLHYGVSCLECKSALQKSELESHWRSQCPERKMECSKCHSQVSSKDMTVHNHQTCPAISVECLGAAIGCTHRSKRGQAEEHILTCTFAKLAPIMALQKQRIDEQDAAQKAMSRKLEVMQSGISALQDILLPKQLAAVEEGEAAVADCFPSAAQSLPIRRHQRSESEGDASNRRQLYAFPFQPPSQAASSSESLEAAGGAPTSSQLPSGSAPSAPGPRPDDLPEPFSADFDMPSPFPPPTTNGPYVSPLHHLLSMHESLRDEMSRLSTALSELDARHSMQTLNENLRTREEISYLSAQVAGTSRQVHWLTQAQLQRQGRSGTPVAGSSASAGVDIAGAGAGVEAAVSSAASALRGAAGVLGMGQQGERRRGHSEEGRTKL